MSKTSFAMFLAGATVGAAATWLCLKRCPPSRIDGQKETRYNGKEGRHVRARHVKTMEE